MRASIDSSVCAGHGLCYTYAPEVFADDPNGYGEVRHGGQVPDDQQDAARRGAANCPERAITLTDQSR